MWKYVDGTGHPIDGVTKLIVSDLAKRSPSRVRAVLAGRNAH